MAGDHVVATDGCRSGYDSVNMVAPRLVAELSAISKDVMKASVSML